MNLTVISKHGAWLRGAALAFVSGVLPVGTALLQGRHLTIADWVSGVLVGMTSLGSFVDQSNAEFGSTVMTWIKGVLYVGFTVLFALQAPLLEHRPITAGLIISLIIPAVFTVLRQYPDKSLSLARLGKPTAQQAAALLEPKAPTLVQRAVAGVQAGVETFRGTGLTDEPMPGKVNADA